MTVWTKEKIIDLLATNDVAVARALVRLNERQTFDEQQAHDTKHRNNKGFRPCHASVGTKMAQYYQKTGKFSPKQAAYWRVRDKNGNMRIGIYANQLLSCIGEK